MTSDFFKHVIIPVLLGFLLPALLVIPLFKIIDNNKKAAVSSMAVPAMNGFVNDNADVISVEEEKSLETYLKEVKDKSGVEIAVLTISSLNGADLEEYSIKVAQTWGLGQRDKDNGALLLVSIKDHLLRIETGYGLEATLTDAKCGQIIRDIITPSFKNDHYYDGICNGIYAMVAVTTGESFTIPNDNTFYIICSVVLIIGLFFIVLIFNLISKIINKLFFRKSRNSSYSSYSGYSSGRSYHSHSSHSSSSGSGGHFGGGGASGSW